MVHTARTARHNPTRSRQRDRCRTDGFALLLVLIAVGIAMTLALGFASTQGTAIGVMRNIEDHTQARYIAESGLAMTTYYIRSDDNWRVAMTEGDWVTDEAYANGTFTIRAADGDETGGDGDLSDDPSDTVYLTAVGSFGGATHTVHAVVTPTSVPVAGNLLVVVPNPGSLSANDAEKETVFANLGWTVTLIDDDSSAADFATAVTDQDVIYLAQTCVAAGLGANLKPLTTGVVSENEQASIDLQMASSFSNFTDADTEVYDNTHYITQPFALGDMAIFGSNVNLHKATPADIAEGARALAVQPGQTDASVLAIDVGAKLIDASSTGGRRVHLPWSRDDTDLSTLTAPGKNLLQRSLEWASVSSFLAASDRGVIANGTVKVKDDGVIDSFDSSEGAYGGVNVTAEAIVSTNASTPNAINVQHSGVINGFALADPPSIISGDVPSQITGSKIQLGSEIDIPLITDPSGSLPASLGNVTISSNTTISTDRHYGKLTINGGAVVTIDTDVTILCDLEFQIEDAELKIDSGKTLSLYLNHKYKAKGAAQVNTSGANPRRLMIYSMGNKHVDFEDTSETYATVNAPLGLLHVIEDSHFYGTFLGDRVEVKNNGQLHQDTSDGVSAGGYRAIVEYDFHEPAAPEPVLIHHWALDVGGSGISVSDKIEVSDSGIIGAISGTISVRTNSTTGSKIMVQDSGVIDDAYVEVGVGGSTNAVITISGSGEINGAGSGDPLVGVGVLASPVSIPAISVPEIEDSSGNLNLSSGTFDISEDKYYDSIDLGGSATLNIAASVSIVCEGEFYMDSSSAITLQPGVTLKLYTLDGFDVDSSGTINANTSDPSKFIAYHQASKYWDIEDSAIVYGQVYHPNNLLHMKGSAKLYGSSNGESLKVEDNAEFKAVSGGSALDSVGGAIGSYEGGATGQHAGPFANTSAAYFDGTNDYLLIAHDDDMKLNSGSVSFWFKSDHLSGEHGLVSKDANGYVNGGHLHVYTNGSRLEARIQSNDTNYNLQSTTSLSTGRWYHAVFIWGERGFKLFLDGSLEDSDSYTGGLGGSSGGSGNTEPLVLGAATNTSSSPSHLPLQEFYEGYLSDVRLYEGPLGANQVEDLYNNVDLTPNEDPGINVVDTSGYGEPLDLNIEDPTNVTWIQGGGLTMNADTRVLSPVAATKIHDALTANNRMTVEVVFSPANLTQTGAARLVTYASTAGDENFIVGQNQQDYLYRVRTTSTGSDGSPNVGESGVLTTTGQQHLVATYDETEVKIYRNGVLEITEPRTGSFATWDNTFPFALANDTADNKPWLGTLWRVAVYDDVLNSLQLDDLFIGVPPENYESGSSTVGYESRWVEQP